MKNLFLLCLILAAGSFAPAQGPRQTRMVASLSKTQDLKTGDAVTLMLQVIPEGDWHIYSLEETGSYRPTSVNLDEKCHDIAQTGKPRELGEKVTEFDKVMGGNLNYFHGPATFMQDIKIKGKHPVISGTIEYQICSGDKCVMLSDPFKIEAKVK